MKSICIHLTCAISIFFSSFRSEAIVSVQRSVNASASNYQQYVKSIQGQTFVNAFIQLSENRIPSSVSLEKCLEDAYMGGQDPEICMKAVKALAIYPLNSETREILLALLMKIEKSFKTDFFHSLKNGLLQTHPLLAEKMVSRRSKPAKESKFSSLEKRAFLKVIEKLTGGQDFAMMINGEKIFNLANWTPPEGTYQWSLITNTHRPLILLTTFSQFASAASKDLQPFAENCRSLDEYEIQKHGLLEVQVFASEKCIAKETPYSKPMEHLTSLPAEKPKSSLLNSGWAWGIATVIGIGMAASLKGKNVKVTWPAQF